MVVVLLGWPGEGFNGEHTYTLKYILSPHTHTFSSASHPAWCLRIFGAASHAHKST